jgi:hypothetical protein
MQREMRSSSFHSEESSKTGYLWKKEKGILKSWKEKFFILQGGSLFAYADETVVSPANSVTFVQDLTPRSIWHLKTCQLTDNADKKAKRKFSFCVHLENKETYFSGKDEADKDEWLKALVEALTKPPVPPPDKDFLKKTKSPR